MEKAKVILVILAFVILLTACARQNSTEKVQKEEARLIVVEDSMAYRIYADKETKVMYLRTKQGNGEAVCVMVNPDGKPLLWEGEQL